MVVGDPYSSRAVEDRSSTFGGAEIQLLFVMAEKQGKLYGGLTNHRLQLVILELV